MANNFTGTATTTPATHAITASGAYALTVRNTDGSTALLVNVPVIHNDDDFNSIPPGGVQTYRSHSPLQSFTVKTAASTATYTAGITEGTA